MSRRFNLFAQLSPETLGTREGLTLKEVMAAARAKNPVEAMERPGPAFSPPPLAQKEADPRRMEQGRQAQAQGESVENWLEHQHSLLGLDQQARLIRNQPMMRLVDPRRMLYRLQAKGHVDFSFLLRGGRGGDFDVKSTTCDRWRLEDKLRHKRPRGHQGRALCHTASLGGVAAVYLRHLGQSGHRDYFVPWSATGPLDGKRLTLHFDTHLAPYALPQGKTWVDAAQRWDAYQHQGWPGLE